MSDLLEQMKATAEMHARAYEAYKAEVDKVQELPEVWYKCKLGDRFGSMHWRFTEGAKGAECFSNDIALHVTEHERGQFDSGRGTDVRIEKTEFDNALALAHGADFTGKLDQIDVPVCELNQATRDEMFALSAGMFEARGSHGWFDLQGCRGDALGEYLTPSDRVEYTYRLRAPKTRPMTRRERMIFAGVAKVCRTADDLGYVFPLTSIDSADIDTAEWASIYTLNDDLTGGEWEAFEVAV